MSTVDTWDVDPAGDQWGSWRQLESEFFEECALFNLAQLLFNLSPGCQPEMENRESQIVSLSAVWH